MAEDNSEIETRRDASPMDVEADDVCWICLDDSQTEQPLMSPCKCPRKVHPKCLARWQLQQAGKQEETTCRFCNSGLADWKASLTPEALRPEVKNVQPIMVVYFEGEIHRIPVKQGSDGLSEFTTRIRNLFRLPEDVDISLTFGCKEPMSGQHLKLEGIGAFDAAVHCASVAAAERQHRVRTGGGASSGGGAGPASRSPAPSAGGATTNTADEDAPAPPSPTPAPAPAPTLLQGVQGAMQRPLMPIRRPQSHSHGGSNVVTRFPADLPPPSTFQPLPSSGGGATPALPMAPPRRLPPAVARLPTPDSGLLLPSPSSPLHQALASGLAPPTPEQSVVNTLGGLSAQQQASLLNALHSPSVGGTGNNGAQASSYERPPHTRAPGRRSFSHDDIGLTPFHRTPNPPSLAGLSNPDPTPLCHPGSTQADPPSPFLSFPVPATGAAPSTWSDSQPCPLPPMHTQDHTRLSHSPPRDRVSLPSISRAAGNWDPCVGDHCGPCAGGTASTSVRPLAYTYSATSSSMISAPHTPMPPLGVSRATSAGSVGGSAGVLTPTGSCALPVAAGGAHVLAPQPPTPPASGGAGSRSSMRRMRRSSSSHQDLLSAASLPPAAAVPIPPPCALEPSPPASDSNDSVVSVGSLTGRLRCSLKAFSRKVARSLHFPGAPQVSALPHGGSRPTAAVAASIRVTGGGDAPAAH